MRQTETPDAAIVLEIGINTIPNRPDRVPVAANCPPSLCQLGVTALCHFLLMVPLIDSHTTGQILCGAGDLSDFSTDVSITHNAQSGDSWRTIMQHTAPHHMDRAAYNRFLMDQHAADREEAHENACEAYHAIEALQRCETWQELPLNIRRLLCASHAALGALADGLC